MDFVELHNAVLAADGTHKDVSMDRLNAMFLRTLLLSENYDRYSNSVTTDEEHTHLIKLAAGGLFSTIIAYGAKNYYEEPLFDTIKSINDFYHNSDIAKRNTNRDTYQAILTEYASGQYKLTHYDRNGVYELFFAALVLVTDILGGISYTARDCILTYLGALRENA